MILGTTKNPNRAYKRMAAPRTTTPLFHQRNSALLRAPSIPGVYVCLNQTAIAVTPLADQRLNRLFRPFARLPCFHGPIETDTGTRRWDPYEDSNSKNKGSACCG